jgi:RNA polymerase sigma-70 factor (ECF subfamily)
MATNRPPQTITANVTNLLGRLRHGDRDAYAELYERTAHILTAYLTVRLRGRDLTVVDDLVQDAFCDAITNPAVLGPDLLASMLRLAARAVTRHDRIRVVGAGHTPDAERPTTPPARAKTVAVFARSAVADALARLTPAQRHTIELRYLDGCAEEHAAAVMGRTVAAMRALEQQALRHLQATCATS